MGIRLIILLTLLVGVLYCLHLLAKDYQAIMAAPRLFRLLFKRELNAVQKFSINGSRPFVRWKSILFHDPIQCARIMFCNLGASSQLLDEQKGLIYMLKLEPRPDDAESRKVFMNAYNLGHKYQDQNVCRMEPLTLMRAAIDLGCRYVLQQELGCRYVLQQVGMCGWKIFTYMEE